MKGKQKSQATFVSLVADLAPELDPEEVLSFIFHFCHFQLLMKGEFFQFQKDPPESALEELEELYTLSLSFSRASFSSSNLEIVALEHKSIHVF